MTILEEIYDSMALHASELPSYLICDLPLTVAPIPLREVSTKDKTSTLIKAST